MEAQYYVLSVWLPLPVLRGLCLNICRSKMKRSRICGSLKRSVSDFLSASLLCWFRCFLHLVVLADAVDDVDAVVDAE